MGIQTGKRFRCRAELCIELGQFLTVGIAQTSGHALLSWQTDCDCRESESGEMRRLCVCNELALQ